jgi:hypothetical protein
MVKLRPAGEGYALELRAREPQTPGPVLCSPPFENLRQRASLPIAFLRMS